VKNAGPFVLPRRYEVEFLTFACNTVGMGWTIFCAAVALAEPTIGVCLDRMRSRGVKLANVLLLGLSPQESRPAATAALSHTDDMAGSRCVAQHSPRGCFPSTSFGRLCPAIHASSSSQCWPLGCCRQRSTSACYLSTPRYSRQPRRVPRRSCPSRYDARALARDMTLECALYQPCIAVYMLCISLA